MRLKTERAGIHHPDPALRKTPYCFLERYLFEAPKHMQVIASTFTAVFRRPTTITVTPPIAFARAQARVSQIHRHFSSSPTPHLNTTNARMSYPSSIKAVGINKTGDVDVIEDLTFPFPEQKPGEVLVKVRLGPYSPEYRVPRLRCFVLRQVQYAGVNFIDTYNRFVERIRITLAQVAVFVGLTRDLYHRRNIYPPPYFPFPLSKEVSGVVAELPTDSAALSNESYKKKDLKKGSKVAVVRRIRLSVTVTKSHKRVTPCT